LEKKKTWRLISNSIGPTGQNNLDQIYDRYRDLTPNRLLANGNPSSTPDEWVVAHIHVNHENRNLFRRGADGQVYIGTPAIRLYHGQGTMQPNYPNANRRVDGSNTVPGSTNVLYASTRSPLFQCPRAAAGVPERLFYLGLNNPNVVIPAPPRILTFQAALQAWGRTLYRTNIVNSFGLSYVFAQQGTSINGPNDLFRIGPNIPMPAPFVIPGRPLTGQDDPINFNFIWDERLQIWRYVPNPR
jgi:chitinase